ncbi:MAG TPA: hypothetical protein VFS11_05530 [Gemmatimonadales bacterium]|nr:hypothetical protein [Gemmatimonadales bacterium]
MLNEWGEPPAELAGLDARLARLEFEPRASLAPEIAGATRRPPRVAPHDAPARGRRWSAVKLAAATAAAAAVLIATDIADVPTTVVDHCCADLDGGGVPDDGVRVILGRGGRVKGVSVYEDRDGAGALTPGATLRYSGAGTQKFPARLPPGLQTIRHCCADYDGGGLPDDGVLVLAVPPDRVLMAVVYEQDEAPPGGNSR